MVKCADRCRIFIYKKRKHSGYLACHALPGNGLPSNHERDALAGHLEAPHSIAGKTIPRIVFRPGSYLDQASSVVAAPAAPDRAAEAAGGADGVVSGLRAGGGLQPWPRVLAGGNDGAGVPRRPSRACNHALPGNGWRRGSPRVLRAVRCPATVCLQTTRGGTDLAKRLARRDLVQQFGQHPSPVRSNRWRLPARCRSTGAARQCRGDTEWRRSDRSDGATTC